VRKKDELTDPTSCLSKAKDDEWLFVLLGRDLAAASTVRHWIRERIRLGKNKPGDAQIIEAKDWVRAVLWEQRCRQLAEKPAPDLLGGE
jgi:hypothetical protein